MIPEQLQNPEFRFCLLKPKDKIPFEKAWQKNGYKFNDPKLLKHIENGGNYGCIGGYGNLIIIDKDKEDLKIDLNTFTIKTGGGGKHMYVISDYDTNHIFIDEMGEVRAKDYQVVGPDCTHPSGNKYEIFKDIPITKFSSDAVAMLIKPYIRDENNEIIRDENGEALLEE